METISDVRALAEFRHQLRRFLAFSEQAARAAGIEPQQHQLLLAVKGLPEGKRPTIRFLAERLQIRHHSAVELIDRLVASELVVRRRSEVDAREVLIVITGSGERLLRLLSRVHRAELRSAGRSLQRALAALLTKPAKAPARRRRAR